MKFRATESIVIKWESYCKKFVIEYVDFNYWAEDLSNGDAIDYPTFEQARQWCESRAKQQQGSRE